MKVIVSSPVPDAGTYPKTGNWTLTPDDPEPGCMTLRGSGPATCDILTVGGHTVRVVVEDGQIASIVVCGGEAVVERL